ALLAGALREARQLHRAVQRLDADRRRIDFLVADELGLHGGGDGGVVDVRADRRLVARHGAAGGGQQRNGRHDGGEGVADKHGGSPSVGTLLNVLGQVVFGKVNNRQIGRAHV